MSDYEENSRTSAMAQWIVSLAISIICCACLFVVLAIYITNQHNAVSGIALRIDLLAQRQDRLASDLDLIRHPTVSGAQTVAPNGANAVPAVAVPAPSGVVLDKVDPPAEPKLK